VMTIGKNMVTDLGFSSGRHKDELPSAKDYTRVDCGNQTAPVPKNHCRAFLSPTQVEEPPILPHAGHREPRWQS
jgi:hypothetical protein